MKDRSRNVGAVVSVRGSVVDVRGLFIKDRGTVSG
jgi:hypothetical protein